MDASGMVAGGGVPRAVAMEEQKRNRAGRGVETERERWMRLWRPLMCWCSKLRMPRLKLTAHALKVLESACSFPVSEAEWY